MALDTITAKAMESQPGPTDKWFIEAGARGEGRLVGRITPAGERRWYFRYSHEGNQVRLPIGAYSRAPGVEGAYTVAEARAYAAKLTAMYRSGAKDLRGHLARLAADQAQAEANDRLRAEQEREAARRAREAEEAAAARRITLRRLFEQWQAAELRPQKRADGSTTGRKDGGAYVQAQFERRVFPLLGHANVGEVTRAELLHVVIDAKASGKLRTAAVLLSNLKQMFAFAEEHELVSRNPLASVRRAKLVGKNVERERTLSEAEVSALARLLPASKMAPRSVLAIWLLLATGCRVGEAMGARWEHVDLSARTWHLPLTKNGRDHTIHLSTFALAQMQALAHLREVPAARKHRPGQVQATELHRQGSPWLFPDSTGEAALDTKTLGKQIADRQRADGTRLRRRTKASGALVLAGGRWTCHDLRRTAATLMAQLGTSGDVIDECLNHVIESRVRRTYIRDRRPVEQAAAFEALGLRLQALVEGASATSSAVAQRAT